LGVQQTVLHLVFTGYGLWSSTVEKAHTCTVNGKTKGRILIENVALRIPRAGRVIGEL
jgi:hypothetical protein